MTDVFITNYLMSHSYFVIMNKNIHHQVMLLFASIFLLPYNIALALWVKNNTETLQIILDSMRQFWIDISVPSPSPWDTVIEKDKYDHPIRLAPMQRVNQSIKRFRRGITLNMIMRYTIVGNSKFQILLRNI